MEISRKFFFNESIFEHEIPCQEQSSSGPSVEQAPREPEIKQGDGQPLSSKQVH